MVFSGLYPVNNNDFEDLREALGKLKLNDSSFTYQPEVSEGLGFGFRCGFLGHAPPRDHPAAARARQRARPGADGPQRHLRDPDAQGRDASSSTARRRCRTPARSRSSASRSCASTSCCRRRTSATSCRCVPSAAASTSAPNTSVRRGPSRLRDAAGGSHLRPVRQAQVGDARLRHDGLRLPRLPPRRPGAPRRAGASQPRGCAVHDRPPRDGRPARPEAC